MTFSSTSEIYTLPNTNDIGEIFRFTERMDWGGSTNIAKAYRNILELATTSGVAPEDMPKYMVVFSDMQFDHCTQWEINASRGQWGYTRSNTNKDTALDKMRAEFARHGYELPTIVFWNLAGARYDNVPTASDEGGVVTVSGFTPFMMKSICDADPSKITPRNMMMEVLDKYVDMLK